MAHTAQRWEHLPLPLVRVDVQGSPAPSFCLWLPPEAPLLTAVLGGLQLRGALPAAAPRCWLSVGVKVVGERATLMDLGVAAGSSTTIRCHMGGGLRGGAKRKSLTVPCV